MKYYNLGIFDIMSEDVAFERNKNPNVPIEYRLDNRIMFDEAISYVKDLGDGWRLPTMKEALFLQEYSDMNILNFNKSGAYWISGGLEGDEYMGEYSAWSYYFNLRRRGGIPKTERLRVRLVRSV
jgi:hypothetical protein